MSEPFIFMRDFNGLKIPFGVVTIKMADTHFSDFLSKEALCIFNDCSKTYSYLGIYSNSAIDINISDHFIIFFLIFFLEICTLLLLPKTPYGTYKEIKPLISLCIWTIMQIKTSTTNIGKTSATTFSNIMKQYYRLSW